MNETLEAKLVHSTDKQRFYKLNRVVNKFPHQIDLTAEIDLSIPRVRDEYKIELIPELIKSKQGVDVICVSDARTHVERLVFAGCEYKYNGVSKYMPVSMIHIDGRHTMMIHGGSYREVHPDEVYLRRIASANGFKLQMAEK